MIEDRDRWIHECPKCNWARATSYPEPSGEPCGKCGSNFRVIDSHTPEYKRGYKDGIFSAEYSGVIVLKQFKQPDIWNPFRIVREGHKGALRLEQGYRDADDRQNWRSVEPQPPMCVLEAAIEERP